MRVEWEVIKGVPGNIQRRTVAGLVQGYVFDTTRNTTVAVVLVSDGDRAHVFNDFIEVPCDKLVAIRDESTR